MIETSIDPKKSIARFGVSVASDARKLIFYFVQKDLSLSIGNYFNGNSTFLNKIDFDNNEGAFSVGDARGRAELGVIQKTSFHKSGVIVRKDSGHKRISTDKDIRSINFKDIKDPIQLRVVYPSVFKNYSGAKKSEVINSVDFVGNAPMMIKVFLAPVTFDFEAWMNQIDSKNVIFHDSCSLAEYKLSIFVVYRRSNNNFVPEGHAEIDAHF